MDDRARQFKTVAEAQLTGPALRKEIHTLRRFLFRNQEHRFTKAAQQALFLAVLAHYGNAAAHQASGSSVTQPAAVLSAPLTRAAVAVTSTSGCASSLAHVETTQSEALSQQRAGVAFDGNDDKDAGCLAEGAADAPILGLLEDALKMPFSVFASPQKDKFLRLYEAMLRSNGSSRVSTGNDSTAATHIFSLVDIVETPKNGALLSLFTSEGEEYAQEVRLKDEGMLQQMRGALESGSAVAVTVQECENGASFVSFKVEDE